MRKSIALGIAAISMTLLGDVPAFSDGTSQEAQCEQGMFLVEGNALDSSTDYGEALQDMSCTSWLSSTFPERCAKFSKETWITRCARLQRKKMRFCIDVYEWPNISGINPTVMHSWLEARDSCAGVGKRLCTEEEWTFACEGEEGLPYPYGYTRDPSACAIDRPWIPPNMSALFSPSSQVARNGEVARLWQGTQSGEAVACLSPFGVHDMTGNVDEWTSSSRKTGSAAILKGGYWSVVRDRCRPSTRSHNEWHRNYQTGFRCCSEPMQNIQD